eukprot:CAMPEP_0183746482 /NCGR_PEP_ID=MMETSP0737-20130205/66778_1 /TAXON_ID=385413 /ORGANISM="Thalassiosira miniscula, Strain CCMP1093" /LENGTH=658 /DNA_ID=CAMNT_0025982177 /DNA_START=42 /DNA_END=2018 /DNA_ORIENTATION=-
MAANHMVNQNNLPPPQPNLSLNYNPNWQSKRLRPPHHNNHNFNNYHRPAKRPYMQQRSPMNHAQPEFATRKKCSKCGLVRAWEYFSKRQWNISEALRKCKNCADETVKANGGDQDTNNTPSKKICSSCGESLALESFSKRQWTNKVEERKCKSCIDKFVEEERIKLEAEAAPSAEKNGATRVCSSCGERCGFDSFSKRQWMCKDDVRKCKSCMDKFLKENPNGTVADAVISNGANEGQPKQPDGTAAESVNDVGDSSNGKICSSCGAHGGLEMFSKRQWSSPVKARKCKSCVDTFVHDKEGADSKKKPTDKAIDTEKLNKEGSHGEKDQPATNPASTKESNTEKVCSLCKETLRWKSFSKRQWFSPVNVRKCKSCVDKVLAQDEDATKPALGAPTSQTSNNELQSNQPADGAGSDPVKKENDELFVIDYEPTSLPEVCQSSLDKEIKEIIDDDEIKPASGSATPAPDNIHSNDCSEGFDGDESKPAIESVTPVVPDEELPSLKSENDDEHESLPGICKSCPGGEDFKGMNGDGSKHASDSDVSAPDNKVPSNDCSEGVGGEENKPVTEIDIPEPDKSHSNDCSEGVNGNESKPAIESVTLDIIGYTENVDGNESKPAIQSSNLAPVKTESNDGLNGMDDSGSKPENSCSTPAPDAIVS